MNAEIDLLREALAHALICPLAQDCFKFIQVMGGKPEEITACDGCRRMLIVWRIQVLEIEKAAMEERVAHGS